MKNRYVSLIATNIYLIVTLIIAAVPLTVFAESSSTAPEIDITRFRVSTSGQFFELHNDGDKEVDMSRIQLAYYNNYDLSKATSSKLVSLSGSLTPGGIYLVNDSALTLCYQATVASASLGFSTTSGMVQLIYMSQERVGGQFTSQVLDSVAWSRTTVAGNTNVQTLPSQNPTSFLIRQDNSWTEMWQSETDPCQYEASYGEVEETEIEYIFLTGEMPPVRHVSATSSTSGGKVNRNVGKKAPIINELLPNPASPQTDADDEFIELYNPNDSNFDLTDFKLAFGSNKPRKYTFPEGSVLKPREFKTFTSGDTSISLSDTEAQVWLLDPNEKVIGQTDPYSKAKDGQDWALDNGKWVWTSVPTPGAMNSISSDANAAKAKTAAATLGISSGSGSGNSDGSNGSSSSYLDDVAPLHPSVLAVVGLAAVGYALYEYRQDISNKIFSTRRYFKTRQALRQKV